MGFVGWNMTKLEDYEQCPLFAKLKHLEKVCTICWKGKLMGYEPRKCDRCGKKEVKPEAYARGTVIGNMVNAYLLGKRKSPPKEIRHDGVIKLMAMVKGLVKKKQATVEESIVLNDKWKPINQKTPDAWYRGKLDVLIRAAKNLLAEVVDWKTGGIDKYTGGINMRKQAKYDHQLSIYNVATLSAFPEVGASTARLVFLDVGPRFPAVLERKALDVARKGLPKAQKAWEQRVEPLLMDKRFSPKPGKYCDWCSYAKGVGGPCKFGG